MAITVGTAGAGAGLDDSPDIALGSRGPAVRALQSKLGLQPDGIDGPQTTAALKDFQQANGLSPDGIAGPRTRAALEANPTVAPGARGPAVSALQQRLGLLVDGIDGPKTTSALEHYQHVHGLTADGIAGPQTWKSLEHPAAPAVVAPATPPPIPIPTPSRPGTPSATPGAANRPSAIAPATNDEPALATGSKQHDAVTKLQQRLGIPDADGTYGPQTTAFVRAFQADHGINPTGSMDAQTWKKLDEVGDASNVSKTANANGHYSRLALLQSMGSRYDSPESDRADISDPSMTPQKTIDMLGNLIHNAYDGKPGFTISAIRSDHHDDGPTLHAGGFAVDLYPNDDSGLTTLLNGVNADPYVTNVGLGGDYDTKDDKALITDTKTHYVFDDNGQTHVHVGDGNYPAK